MVYSGDPSDWSALSPAHELEEFLAEVSDSLRSDYNRIRSRAREDPGTAGDQSEATWATLFENWLPPNVMVRTKGRILSHDGQYSDQMDVVILRDTYPRHLANKKIYLAGGVLAAFECKLTLRGADIERAMERGAKLRSIVGPRKNEATIRDAVVPPIVFGLLAHSHERLSVAKVDARLRKSVAGIDHPRKALDVVCVADLGTWTAARLVLARWHIADPQRWEPMRKAHGLDEEGGIELSYMRWTEALGDQKPNPLYRLIGTLLDRMCVDLPSAEGIADYWRAARLAGNRSGGDRDRTWPIDLIPPAVLKEWRRHGTGRTTYGNPWSLGYL